MKYKCKLCGAVFDVEDGQEAVCPLCGATGDQLEPLTKKNPDGGIKGTQTEKTRNYAARKNLKQLLQCF